MTTDVLYVFRNSRDGARFPKHGDEELMYSLRSVQKFLTGYRRIWVIGDEPKMPEAPGVSCTCLLTNDPYKSKQHNIQRKLLLACHDARVADSFVLLNDDFYILTPTNVLTMPFFRSGTLEQHLEWQEPNREPGDPYMGAIKNTVRQLKEHGLPTTDFELHTPICLNKGILKYVLSDMSFDWSSQWGLCHRSLYANYLKIVGQRFVDVKVDCEAEEAKLKELTGTGGFLSTGPGGMNDDMATFLRGHFPTPKRPLTVGP